MGTNGEYWQWDDELMGQIGSDVPFDGTIFKIIYVADILFLK